MLILARIILCLTAFALFVSVSVNANSKNGITWIKSYELGLQQAKKTQRPVFLYFQAKWCSWCHIYEKDVLSNARVIRFINQYYVPVLMNYDNRPDLLRLVGGFGLPYTVLISADGEVLHRLPGILTVTDTLSVLHESIKQFFPENLESEEPAFYVENLSLKAFEEYQTEFLDYLDNIYDSETGVLSGHLSSGAGLKRPSPRSWLYLMQNDLWQKKAKKAVKLTYSRLYDDIESGFFYFIDPNRQDQHLETSKLLEANAWLSYWMAYAGKQYANKTFLNYTSASIKFLQK